MTHASSENDKSWVDLVTGLSVVYAIFVFIVGALFTLMLFFGQPVEKV